MIDVEQSDQFFAPFCRVHIRTCQSWILFGWSYFLHAEVQEALLRHPAIFIVAFTEIE